MHLVSVLLVLLSIFAGWSTQGVSQRADQGQVTAMDGGSIPPPPPK